MNRYSILFIGFLLISCYAFGQKNNVYNYYKYINKAELAICDSNYQKASDCYHSVFAIKRANIRDAYFAFKLNHLYHYNLGRACEAFHFLVQAGDKAYDEYGPFIDDTTAYPELWNCMKIISDTTKSLVDRNLYNALVEIRKADQQVRTAYYESGEIAYATIAHTDSLNFQKVQQIFKQYKAIDEYISGSAVMLSAVFVHFARLGFTTPDVYYEEMVKNGKLSAASYMQNYDYCYHTIYKADENTTYGTNISYIYVINNTFFIRYPKDIKQINRNRKKLNTAETWEDYVKKVMYVCHEESSFRFYPLQMTSNQEQMEKDERARYDSGEVKGVYFEINLEK